MQHTVRFFTNYNSLLHTQEMNHIPGEDSDIQLPGDSRRRSVTSVTTNLNDGTIDVVVTGGARAEITPCYPPRSTIDLLRELFRQIKNLRNAW
jgi:hypothetical protein